MKNFRAASKLIRFLFITWFYHSLILFGNLLAFIGFKVGGWVPTMRSQWAKSVMNILNMKCTVKGTTPKAPFFLVSNHLSYLDVWVLFGSAKGTFITKSEVKNWPIVGFVLSSSGMIFVNRDKKTDVKRVNEEISKNITKYQGVFLFPEGTTSPGKEILPFKSSLFQYPAVEGIEVTSAAITYRCDDSTIDTASEICWSTDIKFPAHFWGLLKIKEFEASITFSDQKQVNSNRKELALTTSALIVDIFEPVQQLNTSD